METMATSSVTETVTSQASTEAVVEQLTQEVVEQVTTETPIVETVVVEAVKQAVEAQTTAPVATTEILAPKEETKTTGSSVAASKTLLVTEQPTEPNKVALDTDTFKTMVAKAVKGSTMVDVIPLSCLMKIELKDGRFSLTTTDNINYLTLSCKGPENKEIVAFVESKIFSQLVSKLTSKTTILSLEEGKLVVKAGGTYNIAIHTEQDGSMINLAVPQIQTVGTSYKVSSDEIRTILNTTKSCKAATKEIPCLFNYYFDADKILTSDSYKACMTPIKLTSTPICLTPVIVNLMAVIQDEDGIEVAQDAEHIVISSKCGTLIGKKCPSIELEKYPAEGLTELFATNIGDNCKINRTQLLGALDRIGLFTENYQSNKIVLDFGNEGITIKSPSTDSAELVDYTKFPEKLTDVVSIDLDCILLKEEITACDVEDIEMYFDIEAGIQVVCGDSKMMLSVLGEDEVA